MRRVVVCMLALMLLCTMMIATAFADTEYGHEVTFIVREPDGVRIRNPDKTDTNKVARYGEAVQVYGENDYWYKARINGQDVILYKEYLSPAHAEELEAIQKQQGSHKIPITNDMARFVGVCLKKSAIYASVDSGGSGVDQIGVLDEGAEVYVKQTGKYWYRIVYNGNQLGYIKSGRVKLVKPYIAGEGKPMLIKVPQGNYGAIMSEPHGGKQLKKFTSESPLECVLVLEVTDNWAHVLFGPQGQEGYMYTKWLKETTMFD